MNTTIADIAATRSKLVLRKLELQSVVGSFTGANKTRVVGELMSIDAALTQLRDRARSLQGTPTPTPTPTPPPEEPNTTNKNLLGKIASLREKYTLLAGDRRITPSCRLMSAEFMNELSAIIKETITTKRNCYPTHP